MFPILQPYQPLLLNPRLPNSTRIPNLSRRPAPQAPPRPAPGAIVAATKGRISRCRDLSGAPRPTPLQACEYCASLGAYADAVSGSFAAAGAGPSPLAAAAAAAVLTKKRHGAAGVKRGAAFVPFLLSGEAVAVEDPLQGGFHHPAAGVRNQQKPPLHFPRRRRCSPFAKWRRRRRPLLYASSP